MNTKLPGYCNEGIPAPRELCHSLAGVAKVPDKGMGILQNFQKFRVLWHKRTELTKVPSGYKTCCTRTPGIVARAYQTFRSSGYGYECPRELTEVLCRVIPGVNTPIPGVITPGMVCTYPT